MKITKKQLKEMILKEISSTPRGQDQYKAAIAKAWQDLGIVREHLFNEDIDKALDAIENIRINLDEYIMY